MNMYIYIYAYTALAGEHRFLHTAAAQHGGPRCAALLRCRARWWRAPLSPRRCASTHAVPPPLSLSHTQNCPSKVNCLTMVVTFDLVSPVFRLFSSQKLKTKTCYSKCAGASQTLRTQAPAALGGCKCSATHARLTPASRCANLVCDVTGLSVFYVVSACPIFRGRAARFSRASIEIQ